MPSLCLATSMATDLTAAGGASHSLQVLVLSTAVVARTLSAGEAGVVEVDMGARAVVTVAGDMEEVDTEAHAAATGAVGVVGEVDMEAHAAVMGAAGVVGEVDTEARAVAPAVPAARAATPTSAT